MDLDKLHGPPEEITVMCDYAADGIWVNGAASEMGLIAEDFNMEYDDKLKKLQEKLDKWQDMYEEFDFWSDKADAEKTYATPEFKEFLKLGEELAYEVREIIPKDIPVIYFKEGKPNARYIVNSDRTMTLKEKYD